MGKEFLSCAKYQKNKKIGFTIEILRKIQENIPKILR